MALLSAFTALPVRRLMAATLSLCACLTMSMAMVGCKDTNANEAVVTINDDIIVTRGEYNAMYKQMVEQAGMDAKDLIKAPEDSQEAQVAEQIKQYTLNKLIFSALIRNAAEKSGVTVTDDEFKAFKQEQVEAIGGEDALKTMLKARDISEDTFNESLREQLLVQQFVDEHLAKEMEGIKLEISDAEAHQFYNAQKPLFYRTEGVNASHILLKAIPAELKEDLLEKSPNLSKEELQAEIDRIKAEKKAKAEKLLAKIEKDPDLFSSLAKAESDDELSAVRGGKLDTLYQPTTDPAFWEATQAAKIGSLYPELVESAFGYHILMVNDRTPAGQQTFEQVKEDIKRVLKQQRRQQALMEWVTEQRKDIKLEFAPGYEPEKPEAQAAQGATAATKGAGMALPAGELPAAAPKQ